MELRHLQYFMAVAETLNFRKAAERLYISQPPLSRQIKQLEAELGSELFVRSTKKVELTQAGRYFLGEAQAVIRRIESAKLVVKQLNDLQNGLLRIGYVSSFPYTFLSQSLGLLKQDYPSVTTKLYELPTVKQVAAIENNKLDVGLIRAPSGSGKLYAESLYKERFVFVYPKSWKKRFNTQLGLSAFADAPFVFFNKDYAPNFNSHLQDICNRAGFAPNVVHESNSVHSILSLVEMEMGVSILPQSAKSQYTGGGIAFMPVPGSSPQTEIMLVRSRSVENELVGNFVRLLKDCCR